MKMVVESLALVIVLFGWPLTTVSDASFAAKR